MLEIFPTFSRLTIRVIIESLKTMENSAAIEASTMNSAG